MAFEVDSRIKNILSVLQKGLSSKVDIVQSDSITLLDDGSMATANDRTVAIYVEDDPFLNEFEIEGSVSGKQTIEFLSKQTKVKTTYDEKKNEIVLSGKGKIGLKIDRIDSGKEELIDQILDIYDESDWQKINQEEMIKGLSFTKACVGGESSKPALRNIHFKDGIFEACDDYRYSEYESEIDVEDEFLIPNFAIDLIMEVKPDMYCIEDFWAVFLNSDTNLIAAFKKSRQKYPDMHEFIAPAKKNARTGKKIQFPEGMAELLKESFLFSHRDVDSADTVEIYLGEKLTVRSSNEHGWFERSIDDYVVKNPIKFKVEPDMMLTLLDASNEAVVSKNKLVLVGDNFFHFTGLVL